MVANLTMAVNRRSRDDEPDWFNLEIWGKQAQVAADYVKKGSLLGIIGSFKLDRWTDRASGEERSKPVVRVDRLELLGSKRDNQEAAGSLIWTALLTVAGMVLGEGYSSVELWIDPVSKAIKVLLVVSLLAGAIWLGLRIWRRRQSSD